MNDEQDYVFHDEPDYQESSHHDVSAPIYRGRDGINLNRKGNPVMFDSGPSSFGPGPTKQTHLQELHSHYTTGQVGAVTSSEANPRSIRPSRIRGSVMRGTGSVLSEPGPHRLSTPNIPRSKEIPTRRIADVDISLSLDGMTDDLQGMNQDSRVRNEYWMKLMKFRQNRIKEKLERFQKEMDTLTTTVQGAESMYKALMGDVEDLKSNSDEVWQRLMSDEQRLNKLESSIDKLDFKLDEKMELIQEWFMDITARPTPEVPVEIVNSIQEVIKDSAPGAAVDRMREELEDMRESLDYSRHVTEGLGGLVINLAEQVANTSVNALVSEPRTPERDQRSTVSNTREQEIVRKGIERAEKQLRQIISNNLMESSKDISLIKKHKTVDVSAIHAAVGNIQKSLQKYVKFPEIDYEYCD